MIIFVGVIKNPSWFCFLRGYGANPRTSRVIFIPRRFRIGHEDFFFIPDPYVKVWLQFGDKRIEKRKTAIFKCTLNPVFNDTFSFNVPWEKIRECSLDVMVMDFDNIGRNELIGRILLAGKYFRLVPQPPRGFPSPPPRVPTKQIGILWWDAPVPVLRLRKSKGPEGDQGILLDRGGGAFIAI